jgi:hypothetical protein
MSTTSNNSHHLGNELKIQRGIRQAEDDLVKAIQDALENSKYPKNKLEESQFRNLLRVATTTESPEVIKNFLRYQVGRDSKWGRGEGSLAERIVNDIDGQLKSKAEEIDSDSQNSKSTWMTLIRLYLGYGARYLKYLKDGKPKSTQGV